MAASEPVIACVGDSALWCTGTRYEDKTPNLVHKIITGSPNFEPDGDPIPPAQFRARGGAIIGVDYPYRITRLANWQAQLEDAKDHCEDVIASDGFDADECKVEIGKSLKAGKNANIQLNRNAKYIDDQGHVYGFIKDDADPWYSYYSVSDKTDINQRKWTIARDIGWHWPRIVDQLRQFPREGSSKPDLDVPGDGTEPIAQFDGPVDTEPPYAEEVDVLLINGGTNDIELGWLNDPRKVSRQGIQEAVKKHCYDDQVSLLKKARSRFPNALIFLVGYYPYASDWTWLIKAAQFLGAKAGIAGRAYPTVEAAIDNAQNFARFQSYWMRRAVAEVARDDDGPGTLFVARGFGVVNAFDAPEAWSWGSPADETDDTGEWRADACSAKHDEEDVACEQASIGHPNTDGSHKTAISTVDRYNVFTNGLLRHTVDSWTDDDPISLRTGCENYDLDLEGDGLRYCLSHREVDSLRVDIKTGGSLNGVKAPGAGGILPIDPKNDVYLTIEPGRTGNGERFRLETEYNDFQKNSTDRFFIDPMMGRQITADVGPIPESHGMDDGTWNYQKHLYLTNWQEPTHYPSHLTEEDHDDLPYHRETLANSRRLRLGDIERISIEIEDTDPWDLEEISVEINGFIEHSTSVSHGGEGVSGDEEIEIWRR